MPYIGNQGSVAGFVNQPSKQDLTGATGGTLTLTNAVSGPEDISLFINNVRQEPTESYTATGTTVTLQGYTVSATDDIYVLYNGLTQLSSVPVDGSVSTAKIADNAITMAKLATSGTLPALDGSALTGISGALKKIQFIPIPPQAITGTTDYIPRDNTLPLITEGFQVVQANYTPAETTSTIFVDGTFYIGERSNVANVFCGVLFFNDTCVNVKSILGANNQATWLRLQASFSNTTGNALDIEIRCDQNSNFEINGQHLGTSSGTFVSNAGSAFGGTDAVNQTYITVTEF